MAESEMPTISLDVNDVAEAVDTPIDVTPEAEQTATQESSTEEQTAAATDEAAAEEPAADQETEGEDSKDKTEDTKAEETDTEERKKGAEARKAQLQTEIRDLVATRNQLREEVSAKNAEAYKPATADELVEQGMDPAMAEVTALKQRTELAEYNAHVADLTASINTEALQVMHDYPMFDPNSPEYNKDIAEMAGSVYERVAGIKTDPKTGLPYSANVLPRQVYQAIAQAFSAGASTGEVRGQQATEQMLAAADSPTTSATVEEPKVDPFLQGLTYGKTPAGKR